MRDTRIEHATDGDRAAVCTLDPQFVGDAGRMAMIDHTVSAGTCWIARVRGDIAGFIIFAPVFFGQPFIELLYVVPEYRRRGVASALVRHCEAICPASKMFTSTNTSNTPMQRLLKADGYTCCGYVEGLDEGDPELLYSKRLRDV